MAAPKYKSIRAHYDDEYITVYQAYSEAIASAAVAAQKLSASHDFKYTRMTWVKPSWCWMMYRCGYAGKDSRQVRVLALRMTHAHFATLLGSAVLAHDKHDSKRDVVVQWDPERDVRINRLDYRSIQIGIPAELSKQWVEEWIVEIEDVTDKAKEMKRVLDADEALTTADLVKMGLMPVERDYTVSDAIMERLRMRDASEGESNDGAASQADEKS